MDSSELKELIKATREVYLSRGNIKKPIVEEKKTIDFAFASVAAIQDIFKGEILNSKNIFPLRPNNGYFKVKDYERLLGKKVKKVFPKDEVILSWIKGEGLDYGGFQLANVKNQKINFGSISTFSSFAIVSENRVFLKPKKMSKVEAVLYGCATPTGAGIVINQLKEIKKITKFV